MSATMSIETVRDNLSTIKRAISDLRAISKSAFMAAPPMPQGPAPDPSMQQGGAPPMDPAAMQGGMPMDPAAMQGGAPPVDPNTGMSMDPAAMQGGMPMDPAAQGGAPPITPETIDQIVGLLEEMGQQMAAMQQDVEGLKQELGAAVEDLAGQVAEMDKRMAELAATANAPQPAAAAAAPPAW